jgi:S1-C subfamily serine protease
MRKVGPPVAAAALVVALTFFLGRASSRPPAPSAAAPPAAAPAPAAAAVPADLSPDEQDNVRVYQTVNRSVVNITVRGLQDEDFFSPSAHEGTGSGSILDKQGHVLTNYHVVNDVREVSVTLFDGKSYDAKLVGSDPNNDLAVLQIKAPAEKLFPVGWGDSSKLLVGMRVYAIGNPFGLERTLTTGIISSLNRSLRAENKRLIGGVIQTDAAINPGNSGGPLLNRKGELIGITTAIVGRARQSSGIGLAVPGNTARRVVEDLVRFGKVVRADCGVASVLETDKGLLITRLAPDGPAEKAGLHGPEVVKVRRGGYVYQGLDRSKADRIVALDGKPVKSLDDLYAYVEGKKPGDSVVFTVLRDGEKVDVKVDLEQSKG